MHRPESRLPFIILSGTVASLAIVLVFSRLDVRTAWAFLSGPFSTAWGFGSMLNQAGLILLSALGASLALRAGAVNLGGEGQAYAGGLSAFVTLHALRHLPALVALPLGLAAAAVAGAAVGSLSPAMRRLAGTDELISSFLGAQAVIPLGDYLISTVIRDPSSQIVATVPLPDGFIAPSLPGMGNLSAAGLLALAAVPLLYLFLHRSLTGHETLVAGHSPDYAMAMGIKVGRRRGVAFIAAAALTGLAGFMAIQGGAGRVIRSFSSGIGWNGLACAIIARGKPHFCLPAALLFAYLSSAALSGQMRAGMRPELSSLIQALILFLAATPTVFNRGRKDW